MLLGQLGVMNSRADGIDAVLGSSYQVFSPRSTDREPQRFAAAQQK